MKKERKEEMNVMDEDENKTESERLTQAGIDEEREGRAPTGPHAMFLFSVHINSSVVTPHSMVPVSVWCSPTSLSGITLFCLTHVKQKINNIKKTNISGVHINNKCGCPI